MFTEHVMQSSIKLPSYSNSRGYCIYSVDCGIFIMAYAQHIALNLLMEFTKSDMYYFRAKIVYDLYIDQYARWK